MAGWVGRGRRQGGSLRVACTRAVPEWPPPLPHDCTRENRRKKHTQPRHLKSSMKAVAKAMGRVTAGAADPSDSCMWKKKPSCTSTALRQQAGRGGSECHK